jgi:hypothetical protein
MVAASTMAAEAKSAYPVEEQAKSALLLRR